MSDFQVNADDLLRLSKALKGFDPVLRKELHKGLRDAAKPLIPVVRKTLGEVYPKRGGLAAVMAKSKVRTAFRTGTKDPGVSIIIPGVQAKLGENYGLLRHPVFGRPGKTRREWRWVNQHLDVGAIAKAVHENLDKVLPGIDAVLEVTATRVLGEFTHGRR